MEIGSFLERKMIFMALVEVRNLSKRYGKVTALSDVSLDLGAGRIIGLLGPNGSGKSTFIKILAGLLYPNYGTVLVGGHPIGVESKKIVSYLPDVSYINGNQTTRQVLDFFCDFYSDFYRDAAETMLRYLQIDLDKKYKTLSKGTKEKVQLVLVMSRRAKLFLLDEPIAGVDPAAREYILNTILSNYNREATIIISTHLISDVETVLDDVVFINQSKLGLVTSVEAIKRDHGMSVDQYFREVYRC